MCGGALRPPRPVGERVAPPRPGRHLDVFPCVGAVPCSRPPSGFAVFRLRLCRGGSPDPPVFCFRNGSVRCAPDLCPLPRLVETRRGCKMAQAGILYCTRAQWPGRNEIRNRILRAGTFAETYRGILRKWGSGGGATMGGDAHRSPPPAILWFLSHRWERNSPKRAKPCESSRPTGVTVHGGRADLGSAPTGQFRSCAIWWLPQP